VSEPQFCRRVEGPLAPLARPPCAPFVGPRRTRRARRAIALRGERAPQVWRSYVESCTVATLIEALADPPPAGPQNHVDPAAVAADVHGLMDRLVEMGVVGESRDEQSARGQQQREQPSGKLANFVCHIE